MRTARIIQPGVFYHVTSRVNHKEMLLRSPVAKELFLEQLVRLRLRHTCEILDFVVMENHVHLILRPVGKAGLSGVMKFLLGVYTMGFNRIYGVPKGTIPPTWIQVMNRAVEYCSRSVEYN